MASEYHGPDFLRPYMMGIWYPEEWLNRLDNGEWSKDDQTAFEMLYNFNVFGIRPFGSQYDDILNAKAWNRYSDRYQLDYKDIIDPRKFSQSFGQTNTFRAGLNFVSDNIKRLYR